MSNNMCLIPYHNGFRERLYSYPTIEEEIKRLLGVTIQISWKKHGPDAIIYDFDGTLAKGNIPERGLLQELGINKDDFWKEVKQITEETDSDEVIVYMHLLAKVRTLFYIT